jgi:23S rRNA (adenine2503-C2)-methyltransferase
MLQDLRDMTPREIELFCTEELGQRPGQGLRLAGMVFRKRVEAIDSMMGLNRPFREALAERCTISSLPVERTEDDPDGTTKLLYRLTDGNSVEGVLIPGTGRLSLCVSTQVGCASGCGFCLTGSSGFIRNLTLAEIVNQVFAALGHAKGGTLSNIVLMGTGEPLANYDAVRSFIEVLTDRHGMGYAPKKITISTSGLAPMIERLAEDDVPASLAVSLNATTDEVRDRIMPVNKAWPLARLLQALRSYTMRTGRTVTIEYVLLRGINDSGTDAKRLVELTEGLPCMINLLLFNPYAGCDFERPEEERLSAFRDILVSAGRIAVVRKSKGREINAACGQLRAAGD